ncbi:MAG TPA: glycosyltransferase [Polyangiaceae bacterium]|jgi:cellulose synthase/poly-beta-1,6-N-acetylglucosamine synthase-like glycosyltransferase
MQILLLVLYCATLLILCTYGAHRASLVYQCWRHGRRLERAQRAPELADAELPRVTVQLPIYNEATVVNRLLEAAGTLDYPRDRLELQVLDDSTDETEHIARHAVDRLRARGIDAVYVRRSDRHGYKAGALDFGLKRAKGELIAVFDADFIPQPRFLRDIVGHFQDSRIGMVQTRWGHLNRDHSLFTSIQALMLDGHHMVENRARFGAGCMFNFSGTGGIWRRQAIVDAGGWEHDTLTEDLDLSYRAQLAGWRFVYRGDVITPAELPEDMSAFRAQQHRWAKGTVQTARKLLVRVLKSELTLGQRVEACFHMLPHFAYPMTVLLSLLLLPALVMMPASDVRTLLLIDLPLCIGATGSLATFYATAESAQGRSAWGAIKRLPALIALGAGLAPHLTSAVFDGLRSMAGEFVRTPKRGEQLGRYRQGAKLPFAEMALAAICAASVAASIQTGHYFATPFAALFMAGYAYVATLVLQEQFGRVEQARASVPPDASAEIPPFVRAA